MKVGVGDTSPRFSDFSLTGLQLQGAAVEVSPGPARLGFATGTTQRATGELGDDTPIESQLFRRAYRRDVTALRLGFGDVNDNHFHLI